MSAGVTIDRILFATDFSPFSDKAREYVLTLAKGLDAAVIVLHVVETVYSIEEDPEAKDWFDNLQKELRNDLDCELEYFYKNSAEARGTLLTGSPWETIVRYARDVGADLVVVGSQGLRKRERRFLLGTTSHKVVLTSDIPVLIVTEEAPQRS